MSYDLKQLNERFFTDPMWGDMEELLMEYLLPFKSVENIAKGLSNDQIATEVRGRQLMVEQLERFLSDTKIIKQRLDRPLNSFK